ncbi:hypothetical protein P20480_1952 [Pseudoalteromonas sp. BSi20480]|nr:hypothetical protein P20480_1952 [Pseudoalteromonas sp. BSi20480]
MNNEKYKSSQVSNYMAAFLVGVGLNLFHTKRLIIYSLTR